MEYYIDYYQLLFEALAPQGRYFLGVSFFTVARSSYNIIR